MSIYDEIMALAPDQRALVLSECDDLSDRELESAYDDMLDDCYAEIEICGYSYSASHALFQVDPVAYRCGLDDFTGSEPFIEIDCKTYYEDGVSAALEAYQDDQD